MKNKASGSLFGLLTRNYLLFTLVLFLITGGVYLLWSGSIDRLSQPVDWDALMGDAALANGKYDRLSRHFHGEYAYAVLDAEGRLVYSSDGSFGTDVTAGELECAQGHGASSFVEAVRYTTETGQTRCRLTKYEFSDDSGSYEATSAVLDADGRVIEGGLGDGRSAYTDSEIDYLTVDAPDGFSRYKESFVSADGRGYALLVRVEDLSAEEYFRGYQSAWKIWLIFIPLYVVAAGLFIWRMDRTIRRPLERLNEAVVTQAGGEPVSAGGCGGPKEIQRIADSFDELSARLKRSEEERRELDSGRQKLIADISHDLKTPITVISGYADAIADGKAPPEELARYLAAIKSKADALNRLIDAFHEYSKVEHPEFALHMERCDLCEFSREYLAGKYDEIDLAGFTLEVSIQETPVYCLLDELQFARALDNLLSNSLRHNRLGTVLFFSAAAADGTAVLRVGDNGGGIAPEKAKRIFEPFVVGSDARSGGGSGLGLAITKRIVELHGGGIALARVPSAGLSTEFVLTLPTAD